MNEQFHDRMRAEAKVAWDKLWGIQRFLARYCGRKWYIGHKKHDDLPYEKAFYVWWCSACKGPAKNHSQGTGHNRYLYCQTCITKYYL